MRVVDALKGRTTKGAGAASAVLARAGAGQPRSRRPISGKGVAVRLPFQMNCRMIPTPDCVPFYTDFAHQRAHAHGNRDAAAQAIRASIHNPSNRT